ncbi:hypothetical protein [Sphingobium limneticum]|jgi:hypothetical protein|uniref:Uncharacterized protein n=1 Tax=Sphingobium limneticum TaxID=1007511 RepID=A0A5J5I0B5_9SPHN|nr:hypothetical protein [Sphingobium limneticum]KAA9013787.1 hypothetical protein F4U96_18140 [Sphingobium limneticum]KAA9026865.1 hypothetical protein F4U95_18265 [Sphingobium limneticum]
MMTRVTFTASLLVCGLVVSGLGFATQAFARNAQPMAPAKLFDDMLQCRSVADANARLACYDKQVGAIGDAQANNQVAVIDKESVRQNERERFGLATPVAPQLESPAASDRVESLSEIKSTIVSFQQIVGDRWRLQLADGSQWQTLETIAFRVPVANMAVTVKKAALGTYLLRPNGWPAVRARRVK